MQNRLIIQDFSEKMGTQFHSHKITSSLIGFAFRTIKNIVCDFNLDFKKGTSAFGIVPFPNYSMFIAIFAKCLSVHIH